MRSWKRRFERDEDRKSDKGLITVRVKKQHLRDLPTREAIILQACREATGMPEAQLGHDDMSELGVVVHCNSKPDKWGRSTRRFEMLLPKAAAIFLRSGVNTFKPFRFRATKGWFS